MPMARRGSWVLGLGFWVLGFGSWGFGFEPELNAEPQPITQNPKPRTPGRAFQRPGACYFYNICAIDLTAMTKPVHGLLTRREREIMDVLYRRGRATAADVIDGLPGRPSNSTVRTQLRVLEE